MRSSAHRGREVMRPGETDRGPHVRYVCAAQDQRRVSVDRSVPYPSLSVVRPIAGTGELTVQRLAEFVNGALLNPNLSGRANVVMLRVSTHGAASVRNFSSTSAPG